MGLSSSAAHEKELKISFLPRFLRQSMHASRLVRFACATAAGSIMQLPAGATVALARDAMSTAATAAGDSRGTKRSASGQASEQPQAPASSHSELGSGASSAAPSGGLLGVATASEEALHGFTTSLDSMNGQAASRVLLDLHATDALLADTVHKALSEPASHSEDGELPRLPSGAPVGGEWVATPTAMSNMAALSLAMGTGRPLLLTGPAGAGKTTLVRALAAKSGRSAMVQSKEGLSPNPLGMLELHLDDSMDSKTLLGSYVATDVPGEFRWAPGAITQAVTSGRWVLVEDLDRAPFDVLSTLVPLLESGTLVIPGRDAPIPAAPGFQLFATRSTKTVVLDGATAETPSSGMQAEADGLLASMAGADAAATSPSPALAPFLPHFHAVHLQPPAAHELESMLEARAPALSPWAAGRMLASYALLQRAHGIELSPLPDAAAQPESDSEVDEGMALARSIALPDAVHHLARFGRVLSPRDLFKWAARAQRHMPVREEGHGAPDYLTDAQRRGVLTEAVEVFLAHLPAPAMRAAAARMLAPLWGVTPDDATALVLHATPEVAGLVGAVSGTLAALVCGGISLPAARTSALQRLAGAAAEAEAGASTQGEALVPSSDSPLPKSFAATRHARALLRSLAAGVSASEPILVVGETGNGKTSVIQALADSVGATLLVQNLNVQSDSTDLLGGHKPVAMAAAARPLVNDFVDAFNATFSAADNGAFLGAVTKAVEGQAWAKLVKLLRKGGATAQAKLTPSTTDAGDTKPRPSPSSKEALLGAAWTDLCERIETFDRQRQAADSAFAFSFVEGALVRAVREGHWMLLDEVNLASRETLERLSGLLDGPSGSIALTERGDAGAVPRHPNFRLFAAMNPATDAGKRDLPPAIRQRFTELYVDEVTDAPDLAIVANRFLKPMYGLGTASGAAKSRSAGGGPKAGAPPVQAVVDFHLAARALSASHLTDGAASRPRYSLRTLCRALSYASHLTSGASGGGYKPLRALYEGFCMSYLTQLDGPSASVLHGAIVKHVLSGTPFDPEVLARPPRKPGGRKASIVNPSPSGGLHGASARVAMLALPGQPEPPAADEASRRAALPPQAPVYTQVENFYVPVGPLHPHDPAVPAPPPATAASDQAAQAAAAAPAPVSRKKRSRGGTAAESKPKEEAPAGQDEAVPPSTGYVLTPSVHRHLRSLARAAVSRRYPVLLQGPTSSGKTSIVEYLAARTGHTCVRINNHDHTDIAEYIGAYAPNERGKLMFQEGLLVTAVRRGWWLILDELNLAPSEVLEALNRLLDDNRELFIPDTQEVVKPHPHFMLFATQNPPGAYGGRKRLSTAFRNRFLELHVGDLPEDELRTILTQRTAIAPPFAAAMVAVAADLRRARTAAAVFAGKEGFITTRDLLRWAGRRPGLWEDLASAGYMLLAERLRSPSESAIIADVLRKHCRRAVLNVHELYACAEPEEASAAALEQEQIPAESTSKRRRSEGGSTSPVVEDVVSIDSVLQADPPSAYDMDALVAGLHWVARVLAAPRAGADEGTPSDDEGVPPLPTVPGTEGLSNVSWTSSLRRLFVLLAGCIRHSEPVLLVGETGCGKTTVVQLLALLLRRPLHIVNCHAHTETADFLGGLRPVRGRAAAEAGFRAATAAFAASCPPGYAPHALRNAASSDADTVESLHSALLKAQRDLRKAGLQGSDEHAAAAHAAYKRYASLFEWVDGPLVTAMRRGHMFLLDEASLAEDAVLERLNSVLEPGRTVTLAEAGGGSAGDAPIVKAAAPFRFFATMNPGGDFGKRELSPALRNRFTELWVPAISEEADLMTIIGDKLAVAGAKAAASAALASSSLSASSMRQRMLDILQPVGPIMLRFVKWVKEHAQGGHLVKPAAQRGAAAPARSKPEPRREVFLSLRDLHTWALFVASVLCNAHFIRAVGEAGQAAGVRDAAVDAPTPLHAWVAMLHGACLVLLDGLGLGTNMSQATASAIRQAAYTHLLQAVPPTARDFVRSTAPLLEDNDGSTATEPLAVINTPATFGVNPFVIPRGPAGDVQGDPYALNAPTTGANLQRLLRSLQLRKPVLLEGSPGVGKTSLVSALAAASGHRLVRINLSEQTDMADLMGSDLPVPPSDEEGGGNGKGMPNFKWCDGILLAALRAGDWVLLDEMNLASQAVLEGLNSVLDHRGTVFIPELDASIAAPPSFRVFAAQNPISQGGGRKGLPKSFLNRFTKVVVSPLSRQDLIFITERLYPSLATCPPLPTASSAHPNLLQQMIEFNCRVAHDTMVSRAYGRQGSPWEFNLRDLFRWCDVTLATQGSSGKSDEHRWAPQRTAHLLYTARMRTAEDQQAINAAFHDVFGVPPTPLGDGAPELRVAGEHVIVGDAVLRRRGVPPRRQQVEGSLLYLPAAAGGQALTAPLRATLARMATCVNMNWPVLLMGKSGSGKTAAVRSLARLVGTPLREIPLSPSTDATELLGCFEQWDPARHITRFSLALSSAAEASIGIALSRPEAGGRAACAGISESLAALQDIMASLEPSTLSATAITTAATLANSTISWARGIKAPAVHLVAVQHAQASWHAAAALTALAIRLGHSLSTIFVRSFLEPVPVGLSEELEPAEGAVSSTLEAAVAAAGEADVTPSTLRSAGGAFEWVDGDLVRALELGEWVLLDNANYCPGSVLDRLNALLEKGGVLVVNEAGLQEGKPKIVHPHPDFRLFLTVDATNGGEVSRAMRNRCIELSLQAPSSHTLRPPTVVPRALTSLSAAIKSPEDLQHICLACAADVAGGLSAADLLGVIFSAAGAADARLACVIAAVHGLAAALAPLRKWLPSARAALDLPKHPSTLSRGRPGHPTLRQLSRFTALTASLVQGAHAAGAHADTGPLGPWQAVARVPAPQAVAAAFASVYAGTGVANVLTLVSIISAVAQRVAVEPAPAARYAAALQELQRLLGLDASAAARVSAHGLSTASPSAAVHLLASLAACMAPIGAPVLAETGEFCGVVSGLLQVMGLVAVPSAALRASQLGYGSGGVLEGQAAALSRWGALLWSVGQGVRSPTALVPGTGLVPAASLVQHGGALPFPRLLCTAVEVWAGCMPMCSTIPSTQAALPKGAPRVAAALLQCLLGHGHSEESSVLELAFSASPQAVGLAKHLPASPLCSPALWQRAIACLPQQAAWVVRVALLLRLARRELVHLSLHAAGEACAALKPALCEVTEAPDGVPGAVMAFCPTQPSQAGASIAAGVLLAKRGGALAEAVSATTACLAGKSKPLSALRKSVRCGTALALGGWVCGVIAAAEQVLQQLRGLAGHVPAEGLFAACRACLGLIRQASAAVALMAADALGRGGASGLSGHIAAAWTWCARSVQGLLVSIGPCLPLEDEGAPAKAYPVLQGALNSLVQDTYMAGAHFLGMASREGSVLGGADLGLPPPPILPPALACSHGEEMLQSAVSWLESMLSVQQDALRPFAGAPGVVAPIPVPPSQVLGIEGAGTAGTQLTSLSNAAAHGTQGTLLTLDQLLFTEHPMLFLTGDWQRLACDGLGALLLQGSKRGLSPESFPAVTQVPDDTDVVAAQLAKGASGLWMRLRQAALGTCGQSPLQAEAMNAQGLTLPPSVEDRVLIQVTLAALQGEESGAAVGGIRVDQAAEAEHGDEAGEGWDETTTKVRVLSESPRAEALTHVWAGITVSPAFAWWTLRTERDIFAACGQATAASDSASGWAALQTVMRRVSTWMGVALEQARFPPAHVAPWRALAFAVASLTKSAAPPQDKLQLARALWANVQDILSAQWHLAAWACSAQGVDGQNAPSTISSTLSMESVMQPDAAQLTLGAGGASSATAGQLGGLPLHSEGSLQGPIALFGSFTPHFALTLVSPEHRVSTSGRIAHGGEGAASQQDAATAMSDTTGGAAAQDVSSRHTQLGHIGTAVTLFSDVPPVLEADVRAALLEVSRTFMALAQSLSAGQEGQAVVAWASALQAAAGAQGCDVAEADSAAAVLETFMSHCPEPRVKAALRTIGSRVLAGLSALQRADGVTSTHTALSEVWVAIGCLRAQLLCPRSTADPLLLPQWQKAALQRVSDCVLARQTAEDFAQVLARGAAAGEHPLDDDATRCDVWDLSTPVTRQLLEQLRHNLLDLHASAPDVARDTQQEGVYIELVNAFGGLVGTLLTSDRVFGTLDALLGPGNVSAALAQESQWQAALGSALSPALSQASHAYADVVMPLISAVGQVSHGMRLAALSAAAAPVSLTRGPSVGTPAWVQVVRSLAPLLKVLSAMPVQPDAQGRLAAGAFGAGALLGSAAVKALDSALSAADALPAWGGKGRLRAPASRATVLRAAMRRAVLAITAHGARASATSAVTRGTAVAQAWGMTTLSAVVGLWRAQRAEAAAAAAAKEAAAALAPREQTFEGVSEEEQAEKEYRALFPDHRAEFEALMPSETEVAEGERESDEKEAETVDLEASGVHLSQSDALALAGFIDMYGGVRSDAAGVTAFEDALLAAAHTSAVAAHALLRTLPPSTRYLLQHPAIVAPGSSQDRSMGILLVIQDAFKALGSQAVAMLGKAAKAQRRQLRKRRRRKRKHGKASVPAAFAPASDEEVVKLLSDLQRPVPPPPKSAVGWYAFHRDGHPAELKLAVPVLRAFQRAAFGLLAVMPGNAVISVMVRMADKVLRLPLNTPLSKAVTGIELLLSKAEEWTATAPKAYHLHDAVRPLKQLITRWRKLELSSWPHLLRVKEVHYTHSATEWVFQLYSALTDAPAAAMQAPLGHGSIRLAAGLAPAVNVAGGAFQPLAALAPHASWATPLLPHAAVQALGALGEPMAEAASGVVYATSRGTTDAALIGAERTATGAKYVGDASATVPGAAVEGLDWSAAQQKHVAALFDTLERFLRTAPLGELAARVALLQSFEGLLRADVASQLHARVLVVAGGAGDGVIGTRVPTLMHARVAALLHGLVAWYAQFVPRASAVLGTLASPVQRELKDAVKIAKWDERNYYSLKASAEKSSRTLARIVRKYEDILRSPSTQVLSGDPDASASILAEHQHASLERLGSGDDMPHGTSLARHGAVVEAANALYWAGITEADADDVPLPVGEVVDKWHLDKAAALHRRMWQLLRGAARSSRGEGIVSAAASAARDRGAAYVDMLASTIVKRAASLRSTEAPRVRKHKAFVDMLKTLRGHGVPYHAGALPRVMDHARSMLDTPSPSHALVAFHRAYSSWQAVAAVGGSIEAAALRGICGPLLRLWTRGEDYFNRNLDALTRVRIAAASQPSPDVTPREVQITRGLADNLMFMCIQQRMLLSTACQQVSAALVLSRQLSVMCHVAEAGSQPLLTYVPALAALDASHGAVADARAYLLQLTAALRAQHTVSAAGSVALGMDLADVADVQLPEEVLESEAGASVPGDASALVDARASAPTQTTAGLADSSSAAAVTQALIDVVAAATEEVDALLSRLVACMAGLQADVTACATALCDGEHLAESASSIASSLRLPAGDIQGLVSGAVEVLSDTVYTLEAFLDAPKDASDTDPYTVAARNQALAAVTVLDGLVEATQSAEQHLAAAVQATPALPQSVLPAVNDLVSAVLLSVQRTCAAKGPLDRSAERASARTLAARGKLLWGTGSLVVESAAGSAAVPEADDAEVHLMTQHLACAGSWGAMSLPALLRCAVKVMASCGSAGPAAPAAAMSAAFTHAQRMLQGVIGAAVDLLQDSLVLHGHTGKLTYVLCRTAATVFREGFCAPAEEGDGGDEGEMQSGAFEGAQDGTGMGAGEGAKDVSDQIEHEDQVAGLQGEDEGVPPEERPDVPDEDGGIEMSGDFEGAMHDMPDDGDGDADGEDGGEEEELDRQMGDTGADDDVVDQQLWDGDDDDEEEDGGEGRAEFESSERLGQDQGEAATDEIRAKEGPGENQPQAAGDDAGGDGGESEGGEEEEEHPGDADYEDGPEGPQALDGGGDDGGEEEKGEDGLDLADDMALDGEDGSGDEGGDDEADGEEGGAFNDPLDAADGGGRDEGAAEEADGAAEEEEAGGDDGAGGEEDGAGEAAVEDGEGSEGKEEGGEEEGQEGPETLEPDGEEGDAPEDEPQAEEEGAVEGDMDEEEGVGASAAEDAGQRPEAKEEEDHAPAGQGLQSAEGQDRAEVMTGPQEELDAAEGGKAEESAPAAPAAPEAAAEDEEGDVDLTEQVKEAPAGGQPQQDETPPDADDGAAGGAAGDEGQWQEMSLDPSGGGDSSAAPRRQRRPPPLPMPSGQEDDALDPAAALERWQVKLRELEAGAEGDEGAPEVDTDAPQEGGGGGGDLDAVLHETGGAQMLAPAMEEEAEGRPEDDEEGRGDEEAALAPGEEEGGDEGLQQEVRHGDDAAEEDSIGQDAPSAEGDADAEEGAADGEAGEALDTAAQPVKPADAAPGAGGQEAEGQDTDDMRAPSEPESSELAEDVQDVLAFMEADAAEQLEAEAVAAAAAAGAGATAITNAASGGVAEAVRDEIAEEAAASALREGFDEYLASWDSGEGVSRERATEAWNGLVGLTADAASSLCESLRLVLEPTLASRLAGDFRTGKRINMKKVIPYIASNFRKDAIWLRRTKPSQRTYQVLLAVDDSASMRDNGAAGMACEALTTMAKALSALEVGQLGIMSFGREARLLHPFETPFDDEAGARVVSRLGFSQGITATATALQQVVSVMSAAAAAGKAAITSATAGSTTVLQLVFLISDGILAHGSREDIKKWVIECASRNQLLVLVIVDKADPKESVLHMNKISFQGTRVVQQAYLDDYPFPYYLIVRDVASLPLALADALKQWFDMLAHAGDAGAVEA